MEEQEKTCETCQHFYRHYVRRSSTKYIPLGVGHCGDPRARYKTVKTRPVSDMSSGRRGQRRDGQWPAASSGSGRRRRERKRAGEKQPPPGSNGEKAVKRHGFFFPGIE